VSNFWKDRRAFVDDARPATVDEEAEMLRCALEESRLMEEARQKRELEEEAEYKRLLYVDSTLFPLKKMVFSWM
jgi:ATP-dependent exoDNAse (exonuclease V) beta subunit